MVINGLVHINRIKLYFYRDELPDDLENVLEGNEDGLEGAMVAGQVVLGTPVVPRQSSRER